MTLLELDRTEIDRLRRRTGAADLEVYLKRGRSRQLLHDATRRLQTETEERGWAVRGATARGSFFSCGTGDPWAVSDWPEPRGAAIELPEPEPVDDWRERRGVEKPLASEAEVRALARGLASELARAAPRARLDLVVIEDGASESRLGTTRGLSSGWRTRLASVLLQASNGTGGRGPVRAEWVRGDLSELSARPLANRLADLLSIAAAGRPVARDRSEMVVSPEVGARLLAGLLPLFDRASSPACLEALGTSGRLGSAHLTLIDDGRLPTGVLASPVDGEGTPTRSVTLVEEGGFRQPLLPWWERRAGSVSGGCCRRDSWRDLPRVGPSHLYLRPDPQVRAADLVGSLSRGYYLLDAVDGGSFRFAEDRFELGVRGFEMVGGRARMPVADVRLVGRISALLRGVAAVARDLTLVRLPAGLLGSPTLRLQGLELESVA